MDSSKGSSKTIVLGLGNLIRSDDGVGVHAVQKMKIDPRVPQEVDLIEGGTLGLELLVYAAEASRLLLLDAVDTGQPVGTIVRMTGNDLLGLAGGWSAHQVGVADFIATLPLVCHHPQELVLFGVQTANTEWGTSLSPAVEKALPRLVDAALSQLSDWVYSRAM